MGPLTGLGAEVRVTRVVKNREILQYLRSALGLHYVTLAPSEPPASAEGIPQEVSPGRVPRLSEWTHPGFAPKLIFLNYDSDDDHLEPEQKSLFENILRAIKLSPDEVWKINGGAHHFGNVLNRLRELQVNSAVVVLKKEPDIFHELQTTGLHKWAECFSLTTMVAHPHYKKATWQVLQLFLKEGAVL